MTSLLTDEATEDDALGRHLYAGALARVTNNANTPLVIGVFGEWGSGKTSLMRMVETRLSPGTRCVWFDAWQHQSDDNPALALMHSIVDQLKLGEEGRKLLTVISLAFGSMILKATTNIAVDDLTKLGERYESEKFQVRDARARLSEVMGKLIGKARGNSGRRLVIFIDDLDRCSPEAAIVVLEALKLYLSFEGCVFVVGADRQALEHHIRVKHGDRLVGNAKYLDKIVQLPFNIPQIHETRLKGFVDSLIHQDLEPVVDLLVSGLGRNPRTVKRFVNILLLHHELAIEAQLQPYDVRVLAFLLLVQYHDWEQFALIAADPTEVREILAGWSERNNPILDRLLKLAPEMPDNLSGYLYLTESLVADESLRTADEAFTALMFPSPALARVVGPEPLPRTEVIKRLWSYIRRNELQDSKNRRMIRADSVLAEIFGGRDKVSMFDMAKLVSRQLSETEGLSNDYVSPPHSDVVTDE